MRWTRPNQSKGKSIFNIHQVERCLCCYWMLKLCCVSKRPAICSQFRFKSLSGERQFSSPSARAPSSSLQKLGRQTYFLKYSIQLRKSQNQVILHAIFMAVLHQMEYLNILRTFLSTSAIWCLWEKKPPNPLILTRTATEGPVSPNNSFRSPHWGVCVIDGV